MMKPIDKSFFPKGERIIRDANELEIGVETIGDIALELYSGFTLQLNNVLLVPSLRMNLILVS
jgi:hypothetical protein